MEEKQNIESEKTEYALEERVMNFLLVHFIGDLINDPVDKFNWKKDALVEFISQERKKAQVEVLEKVEKRALDKHRIMGEDSLSGGWTVLYISDLEDILEALKEGVKL